VIIGSSRVLSILRSGCLTVELSHRHVDIWEEALKFSTFKALVSIIRGVLKCEKGEET
jgi:hypothetical protein